MRFVARFLMAWHLWRARRIADHLHSVNRVMPKAGDGAESGRKLVRMHVNKVARWERWARLDGWV
jgi:hypothetical protein